MKLQTRKVGLGYVAHADKALLRVDHLHSSRGELSGELTVTIPNLNGHGHVARGRVNLSSLAARTTIVKLLDHRTHDLVALPWTQAIESFFVDVLDQERAGQPIIKVGRRAASPEPSYLLRPLLQLGKPTVLMGRAGQGKSTLARAAAVSCAAGPVIPGWQASRSCQVLALDWETDEDEWNDDLAAIAAGADLEPPEIDYWRMTRALADDVERVAAYVSEHEIGLVIVDSAGAAMGAGREGAAAEDRALRFFAALRVIGATTLIIAQVTGADHSESNALVKAYGSIYTMYEGRSVWELRREREPVDGRTEILLRHEKVNRGPKLAALGLTMVYGRGTLRFETSQVEAPDLVQILSKPEQMARFVKAGPVQLTAVAAHLGVSDGYVRALLSKDHGRRFRRLEDGRIALAVGHV